MTLSEQTLARIIRRAVKSAIGEAVAQARTTKQLSGTVEQLDEDLDVVWVRLDNEVLNTDPTQSSNFEAPGIIPATRLGETFTDEQVRITFDGSAGATAMRTSAQNRVVLPFGAEDGERIDLDGELGTISYYDDEGDLVGFLDPTQWFIGKPGESLARLDPLGGLRLRDGADILRVQLSAPEGLVIKDPVTGLSGLIANSDGLIILDPVTGDRISITTGGTSGTPTPGWVSSQATSPGSSHSTPAVADFDTGDDIDIRFTAASAASNLGAQSYTAPGGWTERSDVNDSGTNITLASSSATKDPADATPAAASFTNTSSGWTRRNGHSVIIRGGGASSPAFRSASTESVSSSAKSFGFDIDAPSGVVEGDMLLAFVAIASSKVPVGWTVPDGWKQLGVVVSGLGTSHVLASGIWYRQAPVSPPASERVTINMAAAAFTRVHSIVVAVSNPYEFPAGLDIRVGNRSLFHPPACSVFNSAAQSVANSTSTALTADSENFDDDEMHSMVSNTARITCKTPGRYLLIANAFFAATSSSCGISFRLNGAGADLGGSSGLASAALGIRLTAAKWFTLAVGDFVECRAFHSHGANLNVTLEEFSAMLQTEPPT